MCILLLGLYIGADQESGVYPKKEKKCVFKVVLTSIHNHNVWAKSELYIFVRHIKWDTAVSRIYMCT